MKIYVASAFEDAELAKVAAATLISHGHEITCAWWDLEYNITRGAGQSKQQQRSERTILAGIEIDAVRAADVVVKVGAGGKGAATEVGCALGMGKRVHMIIEGASWLRGEPNDISVFWFHPQVLCHPVRAVEPTTVKAVCAQLAVLFDQAGPPRD